MPKASSRPRWILPLVLIALVLPLAMFVPRWPYDPEVARFIQRLPLPVGFAAWLTSLAAKPVVYGVLGTGLLLATWRGRLKGLVTTAVLMLIWWYGGEPLKEVVHRARPTAEFVEVVRPASGFSFPSTFATTWFSAWMPLAIYAFRTRQRDAGLAISIVAWLLVLLGAWARIRMGAHWPSDLLMTIALVWSTFALIELVVDRLDG
ncbi:hypothetical protein TBR22_A46580 [Luteitalea sp. TBR-22]|uniref:phosphatase PAP2 family protein n=1 Tax=Luteitalea sp. TBR-22 TaxID=2802971 RepID=UPI001AFBD604|nr:phosphatase PAP2 family protein [Luteitalea sp. TBR-22]BCS35431.1 hypothetical protein TBR22_A46580 [Luteitalea sp. TBR-22]